MLRRILNGRTFSCLPNISRLGYSRQFSKEAAGDGFKEELETKKPKEESSKIDVKPPENEEHLIRLLDDAATYDDVKNDEWLTLPYPKGAAIDSEIFPQEKPKIDPKDTSVFIFPGQGIIKVGQVDKYLIFPNVKEIFEIANEILGYNLLKICQKGPQQKLDSTQFNQPATVVSSLAALEKLREERPHAFENCVAAAGYSVGELSALIFSGAISVEDGIRLVAVRGIGMQNASNMKPQGMLSIRCSPKSEVYKACSDAKEWATKLGIENPVCRVAIYLYPEAKVLAGNMEALQYIEQNAEKYHIKHIRRLPVSGAFHTELMEPALKSFVKLLNTIEIKSPLCPVYANYNAKRYINEHSVKKFLIKQITHPVKWEQIMHSIYERAAGTDYPNTFDICSAGKMTAILRLTNGKAVASCTVI